MLKVSIKVLQINLSFIHHTVYQHLETYQPLCLLTISCIFVLKKLLICGATCWRNMETTVVIRRRQGRPGPQWETACVKRDWMGGRGMENRSKR